MKVMPGDWSRVPISTLLAHLEEIETAQRVGLATILGRLAAEGAGAGAPLRTLDALLICLERAFDAHDRTAARLRSLVSAIDRGERDPEPAQIGRLARGVHVERESILGLLDYACRATASFTCSSGSAEEQELLLQLARWDRAERAQLRLESGALLPRALALGARAKAVVLTVHHLELLSPGGRRRQDTVYCPATRRSVELDWCSDCPLVHRIECDAVHCAPDLEAHRPNDRRLPRLGEDAFVGEVIGPNQVSVSADVPAERIARALAAGAGAAAVLVDDGQHVLGLVEAAEVTSSPADRAGGELLQSSPAILESASLADAVAFMAKTRRRYLPVIRDDERAVGVLSDLDALHWIAASRRAGDS